MPRSLRSARMRSTRSAIVCSMIEDDTRFNVYVNTVHDIKGLACEPNTLVCPRRAKTTMHIHDTVRRKIEAIAERQGFSYRSWALGAGLGPNAVSQFMSGDKNRTLNIDTLQALANYANVSVLELVSEDEPRFDLGLLAAILETAFLTHPDPKAHPHKLAEAVAAMYLAARDQGIGAGDDRALQFAAQSRFREST